MINKVIYVNIISGYRPITKSLINIEEKKTIIVRTNEWNKIPLRITIDIIGVKFGGWGISLEKINKVIKKQILLFLFINFII